ncbi:EAL domain-containing protein [Shewanella sp. KJ2020]|uniref:EAL domain-containing protein n=1 Tax=Shewanella sp. KJ2020 TaxID=2919172 RepID=UPI0020A803D7|nr:EAL domain-containing protein [Shewanella sp. KJ2020]MCP3128272.1 EAL domain-containing protein [Shewanella sp. KJ2020]
MSFRRILGTDLRCCKVKTILSLASSLGLDVVAEGVETEAQFMFLKQQHCPHFQGYLFSKPVSPEHLPEETVTLV